MLADMQYRAVVCSAKVNRQRASHYNHRFIHTKLRHFEPPQSEMLPLDVLPEPIGARPCVSTAIRTYNLRKALGDVALVPTAANNFAHKYTDTGLEPGVYI